MPTDSTVSLLAEIPEDLNDRLQEFLTANPGWHFDDFVTASLSLMLMQLGDSRSRDVRLYLDRSLKRSEAA